MKHLCILFATFTMCLLAACGGDANAPAEGATGSDAPAAAASRGTNEFPALKDSERVQGTLVLDFGAGPVQYRSLQTKLADNLGEETDRRLATAAGKAKIDEANEQARDSGVSISAADLSELTHAMAGKTISDSVATVLRNPRWHVFNLTAKAADGQTASISLVFESETMNFLPARSSIGIKPARAKSTFDGYLSREVTVEIEHIAQNPDGSWAVRGTIRGEGIPAEDLSDNLKGQSLPAFSGSFDFPVLPEMKI